MNNRGDDGIHDKNNKNIDGSKNKDRLGIKVGMLQQQMMAGISSVVDNKAYTTDNPSMGGNQ